MSERASVLGLLVTGPDDRLLAFHFKVCWQLNRIDGHDHTIRYSCMRDDLSNALAAAREAGVTVQQIVTTGQAEPPVTVDLGGGATATVRDCVEEYPVLYLAPHGLGWKL